MLCLHAKLRLTLIPHSPCNLHQAAPGGGTVDPLIAKMEIIPHAQSNERALPPHFNLFPTSFTFINCSAVTYINATTNRLCSLTTT